MTAPQMTPPAPTKLPRRSVKARIRRIASRVLLMCSERDWLATPEEHAAYDAWMAKAGNGDSQAEWDALPLWMRVTMCGECGWLDAVYETDPDLGRQIDERIHRVVP